MGHYTMGTERRKREGGRKEKRRREGEEETKRDEKEGCGREGREAGHSSWEKPVKGSASFLFL